MAEIRSVYGEKGNEKAKFMQSHRSGPAFPLVLPWLTQRYKFINSFLGFVESFFCGVLKLYILCRSHIF